MIITGMEHFQDVCKKKLVEWYNNSCMIHEGPNAIKPINRSNILLIIFLYMMYSPTNILGLFVFTNNYLQLL